MAYENIGTESGFDYCPNCGEIHAIDYDCGQDFDMVQPTGPKRAIVPDKEQRQW